MAGVYDGFRGCATHDWCALASPVPDVVLGAGLHPSNAYVSVDADVSGLVCDALLSVEGGLPDDVLLSIPEGIMLTRDGVAAVAHIGARVVTTSDQSVAALSSWYNEPTPITKAQMISNALVEWLRVTEQLSAEGRSCTLRDTAEDLTAAVDVKDTRSFTSFRGT